MAQVATAFLGSSAPTRARRQHPCHSIPLGRQHGPGSPSPPLGSRGTGPHVADTTIGRSRDHGRSWDTEPKGFAVAPRANIEALTMACWPGGYELFVGDTEGTVHMSEDGGNSWTRIADDVGSVTKGNHAAALRGEIRPRAAAAAAAH
jgi:hypothetical protein